MTENQQPYEIKVGQHGKNCECSKCQPVKTTFCECETCQAHSPDKQESTKDRLKRFLAEAKDQDGELRCEDGSVYRGKVYEPEVSGESAKEYNRDEEGMPCDFCSHHVRAEPSYCVECGPENSNYDGAELEVEENAPPCIGCAFESQEESVPVCSVCKARDRYENGQSAETPIFDTEGYEADGSEFVGDTLPNDHEAVEKRGTCLRQALEIINGERQDSYGNPEDSFQLIADYWTCYLESVGAGTGQMIKPRQVAEMMALFKIARMSGQKTTGDNYADAAGYIALAGDMI